MASLIFKNRTFGRASGKNAVVALETALILARKGYDRICEVL